MKKLINSGDYLFELIVNHLPSSKEFRGTE